MEVFSLLHLEVFDFMMLTNYILMERTQLSEGRHSGSWFTSSQVWNFREISLYTCKQVRRSYCIMGCDRNSRIILLFLWISCGLDLLSTRTYGSV